MASSILDTSSSLDDSAVSNNLASTKTGAFYVGRKDERTAGLEAEVERPGTPSDDGLYLANLYVQKAKAKAKAANLNH